MSELARLQQANVDFTISIPGKNGSIDLGKLGTAEFLRKGHQQDTYEATAGQILQKALSMIINSKEYQLLPDDKKASLVEKIIREVRTVTAKQQLQNDKDLRQQAKDSAQQLALKKGLKPYYEAR